MVQIEDPIISECSLSELSTSEGIRNCFAEEHARGTDVYLLEYPTVYVVYCDDGRRVPSFEAYVGETNDIVQRTLQHVRVDPRSREDWRALRVRMDANPDSVRQFVIGHPHFNKSITLDFENRMMHYLLGAKSVKKLNNRRQNPQGQYFPRSELGPIFSLAWGMLHQRMPKLFPPEQVVKDTALFKASPFHELSDEQLKAEKQILDALDAVADEDLETGALGKLIIVEGAAGTGKTVLISHLFNELAAPAQDASLDDAANHEPPAYLLVNHDEQKVVYDDIAVKLGLQGSADKVVLKPVTFINKFSKKKPSRSGNATISDVDAPSGRVDIALIDEAHLLRTQSNQAYQGNNMLLDVMRRSKVTVAVFDPYQILESAQQWDAKTLQALTGEGEESLGTMFSEVDLGQGVRIERSAVVLKQQFRIDASDETIQWISDFLDGKAIGQIPYDEKYQIKVFDSPIELHRAIKEKVGEDEESLGLSRLLATYDWPYSGSSKNVDEPNGRWNVELHCGLDGAWKMGLADGDTRGYVPGDVDERRFCLPWNYGISPKKNNKAWAERPETIDEVGSTFTIQGFDLNYAGVIIGPSVKLCDGHIVFNGAASCSRGATNRRGGTLDYSKQNLHNELNVLLKRGVHGLYLFAVDPGLQAALKAAAR